MHLRCAAESTGEPLAALPVRSHKRCVRTVGQKRCAGCSARKHLESARTRGMFRVRKSARPRCVHVKQVLRLRSSCGDQKHVRRLHAAVSPSVRFCSLLFADAFFACLFRAHCMVVAPLSKRQKPRMLLLLASSESSAALTHRLTLGSVMSVCVPRLCDRTDRSTAGLPLTSVWKFKPHTSLFRAKMSFLRLEASGMVSFWFRFARSAQTGDPSSRVGVVGRRLGMPTRSRKQRRSFTRAGHACKWGIGQTCKVDRQGRICGASLSGREII